MFELLIAILFLVIVAVVSTLPLVFGMRIEKSMQKGRTKSIVQFFVGTYLLAWLPLAWLMYTGLVKIFFND